MLSCHVPFPCPREHKFTNAPPHICIGAMRQKALYKHIRTILLLDYVRWTTTFLSDSGTSSCHMPLSHSTFSHNKGSLPCCMIMPIYMPIKISAVTLWHHQAPGSLHYRCYIVHVWDMMTDRVVYTVELFPEHFKMPRTASKDLATITAI
jgi:hypothetical protein